MKIVNQRHRSETVQTAMRVATDLMDTGQIYAHTYDGLSPQVRELVELYLTNIFDVQLVQAVDNQNAQLYRIER